MKRAYLVKSILILAGICWLCLPCYAKSEQGEAVRAFFAPQHDGMTSNFEFRTIEQELDVNGKVVVTLEFDFGQATLKPAHLPFIDSVTRALQTHPDWHLSIEGHTDSTGNVANNKRLSLLRAETIRDALIAKGITSSRLACIGYGDEKPLVPNDLPENRACNRRVELIRTDAKESEHK